MAVSYLFPLRFLFAARFCRLTHIQARCCRGRRRETPPSVPSAAGVEKEEDEEEFIHNCTRAEFVRVRCRCLAADDARRRLCRMCCGLSLSLCFPFSLFISRALPRPARPNPSLRPFRAARSRAPVPVAGVNKLNLWQLLVIRVTHVRAPETCLCSLGACACSACDAHKIDK